MKPKTSELAERFYNDLRGLLGIGRGVQKKFVSALSKVTAALAKQIYNSADEVRADISPLTCSPQMLDRHGLTYIGRAREAGNAGVYSCTISASADAFLAAGSIFNLNGKQYVTDAGGGEVGGVISFSIRALTAGSAFALKNGDTLRLQEGQAGISNLATVTDVLELATDAETIEEYRAKVVTRAANQLQGCSRADIRAWAESVVNVQAAYPVRRAKGSGEVDIYIEAAALASTDGRGTPSQALLNAVRDYIEPNIEPLTSGEFYYNPIQTLPVQVLYTGAPTFDDLQAAETAVVNYLATVRPFVAGADSINFERKGLLRNALITSAVVSVAPAGFSSIVMRVGSLELAEYNLEINEIPYFAGFIIA